MAETWDQDDRTRSGGTADPRQVQPSPQADVSEQGGSRSVRTGSTDPEVRDPSRTVSMAAARADRDRRADLLGGVRWGAVFFGWLCATGVAVLLVALLAGTGTAIGLTEASVDDVVDSAAGNAGTVSLAGAIGIVVVLAVGYLAGGYVAARMARFSGRAQGVAVWVLGLVITILVALVGLLLGSAYDVLARLDLPRIPIDEGTATTGGVITLLAVLLVTLLAAVLGGHLGDRFHRRIDEIDLTTTR